MAFKIRRGTNGERLTITPAQGELIYTTDTKKLYIGDGTTVGGVAVDQGLATTTYVDNAINDLVDGAASTLDTLKELADALGSDPNFAGNLTTALADKVNSADLATVATSGDYDDLTNKPNIFSGDYDDLSNKPTIPSISGLASETYVDNKVSDLVNGATSTLDTLKELAEALGNDQNFATTVTNSLANKANVVDLSAVATSGDYDDLTNKPNALINSDTGTLTPGDMFFTQTGDTVSMGSLAAQNITAGPSGIQIAGTGGITIMGVATAGVTLGGGTSGAIDFASGTTGIDYNDLDNKPSIPDLGNVAQDILPTTDVTYDLGSPSKRFRDLYLSTSTLYLGETAISVDPVKGLQVKTEGGGEGFGSGFVEWLDTPILRFGDVDMVHPLLQILQRLKKGDQLKEVAQPYPGSQIGPADFLLTVTGPVVLGTPNAGFVDVDVPVNISRGSFTTGQSGGTKYYVGYVEFRTNPITDVSQLIDDEGLLDRTSISSGPTAPGSAAVASSNNVSINFSDMVGTKFKFNRDGKIDFPATQYGSSVSTMFAEYGFRFRPTWNGTGTGPELAISWNDGIELRPVTNDHFTVGNKATPFFIQGTDTDAAGKLPGDVYIDGGRNGLADVNGVVNIGRGYTNSINIGRTGTATTITFNDGSILNGGDITGDQNVDGGGGAVPVWSSPVNTAGMTAKVVVSGKDLATGETQSCEVLLAKKQGSQSISATVYGIVHTSATPLFTVSATVETDGQIRVNATVPGSIATVKVKSVGRVTVF